MENVDHAMFSGLLFGTTFASVPIIKGQVLRYYSTADQFRSIDVKNAEIEKLEQINLTLQSKIDNQGRRGILPDAVVGVEVDLQNRNTQRIE